MYQVQIIVKTGFPARDEVSSATLHRLLGHVEGVKTSSGPAVKDTEHLPRLTGLEVLATFATSAAAYQLARAIRDFVNRQKVRVEVRTQDGRSLTIEAEGGHTAEVADLVGFLTSQHAKSSVIVKDEREPTDGRNE